MKLKWTLGAAVAAMGFGCAFAGVTRLELPQEPAMVTAKLQEAIDVTAPVRNVAADGKPLVARE